jgi:adenosylcobinamide-phosphate synthase
MDLSMSFDAWWQFILVVVILDMVFGDPAYHLHPVRLIGLWSLFWERQLMRWPFLQSRGGGVLHWLIVVGGAFAGWLAMRLLLARIDPKLTLLWDIFIGYSLLCTRDLFDHGRIILRHLDTDLTLARHFLSRLVGRDTGQLQQDGVVRATIESLAENLTDGVLTPLWALCLFGVPGLVIVKTISTLDSMVGHRTAPYQQFGWAAARSDDWIHWLPARLSVGVFALAAAILRLHPRLVIKTAQRDHGLLPSPNSGWSEAACAGALRIRLLGPIHRHGEQVNTKFIGDPDWPMALTAHDLQQALRLIMACSVIAVGIGLALTPIHDAVLFLIQ